MNTKFLFPHKFKKLGWIMLFGGLMAIVLGYILEISLNIKVLALIESGILGENSYFKMVRNDVFDELILIFLLIGGLLIGFAKLKSEDEFIAKIRYESLVWATYFNVGVMLFSTVFIYGMAYFQVLLINVFSLLIFFIIRFHYKIHQLNKNSHDEE